MHANAAHQHVQYSLINDKQRILLNTESILCSDLAISENVICIKSLPEFFPLTAW